MFRNHGFETFLSAAVILIAAGFVLFMRWQTGTGSLSSYRIEAVIPRADQLNVGTDVRIGGVVVGKVAGLALQKTYRVKVELDIRTGIPIPVDSHLGVTGGLMSSPYLTIDPGQSKQTVAPGGALKS